MGYNTNFTGELKFTTELSAAALLKLQSFFDEDCRDHPEWGAEAAGLTYIDLELTKDGKGIQWNGAEKTYELVEKINLIIGLMKKEFPEFGLSGSMTAQGEDVEDRWHIVFREGREGYCEMQDAVINGRTVECPHCKESFLIEP
jgi:hypothetical protein